MATKKTIRIDEEKCVGCEQCVSACPSGALQMVDGKAKLVREDFCDSLGVCIGECPVDAIDFIDVEIPDAPAKAASPEKAPAPTKSPCGCPGSHEQKLAPAAPPAKSPCGCPGSHERTMTPAEARLQAKPDEAPSALSGWPIQLHLVQPNSSMFQGKDILVAASCSAFACGGFHQTLLAGKSLVIACPKLDRQDGYIEKLTTMFAQGQPKSVTVARLEVPCCMGLTHMVQAAKQQAKSDVQLEEVIIGIDGSIKKRSPLSTSAGLNVL